MRELIIKLLDSMANMEYNRYALSAGAALTEILRHYENNSENGVIETLKLKYSECGCFESLGAVGKAEYIIENVAPRLISFKSDIEDIMRELKDIEDRIYYDIYEGKDYMTKEYVKRAFQICEYVLKQIEDFEEVDIFLDNIWSKTDKLNEESELYKIIDYMHF